MNEKRKGIFSKLNISIIAFIIVVGILVVGIFNGSDSYEAKRLELVKEAVWRATISCYAIEGIYPPDIKYLQDHYGLAVDQEGKDYTIYYNIYASNVMPDIDVLTLNYK